MGVLSNLEPKEVFAFFEEISQIPRPSHQEEKISKYLLHFAKERGLEHYRDEKHNVIIIKEASEGYEAEPPVRMTALRLPMRLRCLIRPRSSTRELNLYARSRRKRIWVAHMRSMCPC